ncbi:laccase-1 [Aspergillus cavernicola]|uniref:Laccase-1 n=1 Tax=Aspergillus cavernicola TaxID=176166 RepID=A0ABR4IK62_9EURO
MNLSIPILIQWLCLSLGLSYAKLVHETLELTWELAAPNGGEPREMILTNRAYPGPDLIWDEGDDIEVLVINHLPFNTTVHWHGLDMRETPWADGVPGLSQTPIEPDSAYVYTFKAYPAGTFWYHSHYKGLMQDGQVGAIYIRRKPDAPRPYSAITEDETELEQLKIAEDNPNLILATDWTYLTAEEYHNVEIESGFNIFCVDNLLINGKGSVYCPGHQYLEEMGGDGIINVLEGTQLTEKGCLQPELYNVQGDYGPWNISAVPPRVIFDCIPSESETTVIPVNPEENPWTSINFIGGVSQKALTFSLDNHSMWVYEVDGQLVEPREVEMVAVFNGARYAVMVKLDQKPGEYAFRVADNGGDQVMSGYAILSYTNAAVGLDSEDLEDFECLECFEEQEEEEEEEEEGEEEEEAEEEAEEEGEEGEEGEVEVRPQANIGPHSSGYMDYGGKNTSSNVRQLLFTENLPAFGAPPPPPSTCVSKTLRTGMTRINNSYSWSLGKHVLYEPELTASTPLLFEPDPLSVLNEKYALTTETNTWVDIILEIFANVRDPIHPPHPIHKHGNRAYIVGRGVGSFNWSSVAEAEVERPELFYIEKAALRDTFVMDFFDSRREEGSWMVIRYFVTGKFASLLHCHIASHQVGGMALALLDGIDVWDSSI